MNKHDFIREECTQAMPELLAVHSDGTKFYRCKNCGHAGPEKSFTEEYCASEILQPHQ